MSGPRIARLLARLLLPRRDREFIIGDLDELYAKHMRQSGSMSARLTYIRDLIASIITRRFPLGGQVLHRPTRVTRTGIAGRFAADLRHAARQLYRQPVFTLLVVLTLGIGVGAAGAVFNMANQMLLHPVPGVTDSDGLAILEFSTEDQRNTGLSGPDVEELRRTATLLEGLATFDYVNVFATVPGNRPIDTRGYTVYGDYFRLLGIQPAAGRLLEPTETGPNANPFVCVISEQLWERLFNRSPGIAGRSLELNGRIFTVVGVAGNGFRGTDRSWSIDVWLPRSAFVPLNGYPQEYLWSRQSMLNQDFVVRPTPGTSLQAAEHELNALLDGMAERHPGTYITDISATLHNGLLRPYIRELLVATMGVLAAAAIVVLLIPCANVANLLIVRDMRRSGEVAVRRALGASPGRIARQRLTESLLLGTLGVVVGLGVSWLIGLAVRGSSLWGLPSLEGFVLDARVVGFASAAILLTTVLAGTLPAFLAARLDVSSGLRCAGRQSTRSRHLVLRGAAALQVALSLTLLIGGLLLVRTVRNLYSLDPGLTPEGTFLTTLYPGMLTLHADRAESEHADQETLHKKLLNAVSAVPHAGLTALEEYGPYDFTPQIPIALHEQTNEPEAAGMRWVSDAWFDLLQIQTVSGRTFRATDRSVQSPVPIVVTASLANRLFGAGNPLGQQVIFGRRTQEQAEIIGVVEDVRLQDLRTPPDEAFFLPAPQTGPAILITVLFRPEVADPSVIDAVRTAIESVVPDLPVPQPTPLTDRIDQQLSEQRMLAKLLGLLSGLAVVLAAVGLYGVVAFEWAGRKRELGIRLALGADTPRILRLVLRSALAIVTSGVLVGLVGAYFLSRVIENRLFGVSAVDTTTYVVAIAVLSIVTVLACWAPGAAAVRVDPVDTLRTE